ncbi:hypothetical protein [Marinoscillum sp. MHG1-6]|uniref:hypothetical protein n=1 Tax=Marinoscillum sp. MHG1-6 TaxID=2959627 RepID=UPI002157820B|nr:hypothetical protein [Marinoscillum sp. MHG1-6]
MNRFNISKEKKTTIDESPELRRGEFKKLVIERMNEALPDFGFDQYKNSTYYFARTLNFEKYPIYEDLHVNFSLKEGIISCSVSSCFNPTYRFTGSYQSGILNNHFDLLTLKRGTGIAPIVQAYYFHNGRVNTTAETIKTLVNDFSTVGMEFLESRFASLSSNLLLNFGLAFIENISTNKEQLKEEFQEELKSAEYVTSRIKHPMYLELKEKLQSIPNQTKELRQLIPGFAFSLIEMYYENNGM